MNEVVEYFNDPLDPARSLQLNNRYWAGESFRYLEVLREADEDVEHRRYTSIRKTIKPVKALLPDRLHRVFLSRLVYSIMYRVVFPPIRFSIQLSDEFVRANSYDGSADQATQPGRHTEELKYIVDLVHGIYRDHYGMDKLSSEFAVRYIHARHPDAKLRMTQYGDFSDFHLDEGKDFTAIIYLAHVDRQNGCFTYIDNSYAIRKSHLLRALHQVVDILIGPSNPKPEQRSHLPLELRGSMAIGNYLDDAKRERLRDCQVQVTGDPGHGIIFNGFDTMHRGGQPLAGHRTALFISTKGHINMRLKKAACDLMAYLWL